MSRERLVDLQHGERLPGPAADRVAASLREACLRRREREEVARELEAHFEDGLARGCGLDDLLRDFGDPAIAGSLIRRGVRRRRSRHPALLAMEIFSLLVLAGYLASFTRLHLGGPETPAAASAESRVEALAAWSTSAPPLAEPIGRGRRLMAEARSAAREGNGELETKRLAEALDTAREIAKGPSPAHDLAALRLAVQTGLPARDIGWRPEKVRGAFRDLLASLYTRGDEGRLTAAGLRIYQAWNGKTDPGLAAVLLEPAYFPHAADRGEVTREFERFLALAADPGPAFEREKRLLQAPAWRSLRFIALAIPLEHLAAVRGVGRAPDDRRF